MSLSRGRFWGVLAVLGCMLIPSPIQAFDGSGKESWMEAQKYLGGGRPTPEEVARIQAMSEVERYQEAVKHLEEAERHASTDDETQRVGKTIAGCYNRISLAYAAQKDYKQAAAAVAEAIRREDSAATLHANLAQYQIASGDWWDATQSLSHARDRSTDPADKTRFTEDLVKVYMKMAQGSDRRAADYAVREIQTLLYDRPDDQSLLVQLGQVHLLRGDGAQALETWEKARGSGTFPEGLEEQYQKLKASQKIKTDNQFVKDGSLHFQIEFDDRTQSAAAQKFLDMLEEAYTEVGARLELRPEQKVLVTVYSGDQFDAAIRVPWAAGVHAANHVDIRVSPRQSDTDYRNTLQHEYTHHLVDLKASHKPVPTWLHEGIAMSSEPKLNLAPFQRVLDYAVLKKGKYISFKLLEGSFTQLRTNTHILLAYAQSYSIVKAMVDRFGMGAILKILESLGTGQDYETSFQTVTRVKWADFERQWFEEQRQRVPAAGPGFEGLEKGGQ